MSSPPDEQDATAQAIAAVFRHDRAALLATLIRVTGDPVVLMADPGAKEEDLQALRVELGLDRTYVEQYIVFATKLARGNLGKSFMYRIPVFELYLQRLPASLQLAVAAAILIDGAGPTRYHRWPAA